VARLKKILLLLPPVALSMILMLAPAAATLQELQVGMEVPDFSLTTMNGATKKVSDLNGERLTILFFWSTWSKNSEKGLARMERLYRQYRDKGLRVVGINADGQTIGRDSIEQIRNITKSLDITFPVFLDQGLRGFHDTGVIALPTTVIINHEREIKYELSGYPLVGSEEMADYVTIAMEGKKTPVQIAKKAYQPAKDALRFYNMGRNTLKNRRTADMAETWFKKAIASDPRFVLPYLSLGKLYLQRKDIPAAKEQFQQSLTKDPDNVVALCELGMINVNEGKTKEALIQFDRTMKADDSYTPCYYYRGYALAKTGSMAEALRMFDAASSINPMDSNIHLYKGRFFDESGKTQQAAEEYRQALEMLLSQKR
jgi:tetratricopeptide (TPR) repeat protein